MPVCVYRYIPFYLPVSLRFISPTRGRVLRRTQNPKEGQVPSLAVGGSSHGENGWAYDGDIMNVVHNSHG